MKIGLIGGGMMGEAIIKGVTSAGLVDAGHIYVSELNPERRGVLQGRYGVNVSDDGRAVVAAAEVIVLAVKPQNLGGILAELAPSLDGDHLCISIAAGKTLAYLEQRLPRSRVVRVMPNLGWAVGEGVSAYCTGTRATEDDARTVASILESCGRAVALPDAAFDAVTALSGSGPAFLAYCLEGLVAGAVQEGLPEEEALLLAIQTMRGTAALLQEEQGMSLRELMAAVTSARGTTWAGFKVLEPSDVTDVLCKTIHAAAERSRELSSDE